MRHRVLIPLLALVLAAGCSVGNGNEEELVEDYQAPSETTSSTDAGVRNPATDVDRPDEDGEG